MTDDVKRIYDVMVVREITQHAYHVAYRLDAMLRPVHTGDYSRRFRRQFVAENGDSRRIRQQSPVLATVAELGDYSRQCGQAISRL